MKPDANTLRQRRRDRVKARTECPKCGTSPGHPCYEVEPPSRWGPYPQSIVSQAGVGGRKLGGLHKERWAAYNADVVTRLGDVVRDDE